MPQTAPASARSISVSVASASSIEESPEANGSMRYFVSIPGAERVVTLTERPDGSVDASVGVPDGAPLALKAEILARRGDGVKTIRIDGKIYDVVVTASGADVEATL